MINLKRILFTLLLISIAFVGLSFISAADVDEISSQTILPEDLPIIHNDSPVAQYVNDSQPIVEKVDDERPTVLDIDDADDIQIALQGSVDVSQHILHKPKWHDVKPHTEDRPFIVAAPIIGFTSEPILAGGLGGGGENNFYATLGSGLGGGGENNFYANLGSGIGGGDNPHIIATLGSGIGGGDNPHIIATLGSGIGGGDNPHII